MIEIIKKRWALFLVVITFTVAKIPHLFYPYYWDESWPYAVAIKDMYKHGISLLPTAIDPELSRGHPLFFHALAASWMNIFGSSHLAMHSFALFISISLLISIYEIGLKIFNQKVAILSITLVATQVIFFVQSSFVLCEILVAFLSFLSIYFYSVNRYLLTVICLTLLFYTKESGLIVGFVLFVDAFAGLFYQKKNTGPIFRLISVIFPIVFIAIFFLVQKHYRGWYIFPLHNSLVEHKWSMFWYNFRMSSITALILGDNRNIYLFLILFLSIAATIKCKNIRYLIIFFPAIIIYYYVGDMRAGRPMPSVPFFILFIISIFAMFYLYDKLHIYENSKQKKFINLSVVFIFCFCCFSAMNFFTPRYMLAAIIPFLFLSAFIIDKLISNTYPMLFYPILLIIIAIGYFTFRANDGFGDCDLGAYRAMDIQKKVVDYMEINNYYLKSIGTVAPLENQHLRNPSSGFLNSERIFTNVHWYIDNTTDYAIFDDIEPDYQYSKVKNDTTFHQIKRFQNGNVWAEIYERK